ncbi:hypothetical protein [Streptomyces mayteni]
MDKRYEVFCLIDRCFYDTPERLALHSDGRVRAEESYETARRQVPEGWRDSATRGSTRACEGRALFFTRPLE